MNVSIRNCRRFGFLLRSKNFNKEILEWDYGKNGRKSLSLHELHLTNGVSFFNRFEINRNPPNIKLRSGPCPFKAQFIVNRAPAEK
jgi:hypothetical protein